MRECLGEEILQSYLDGELSGGSMESVSSHLASCRTCAAVAHELESVNNLVAAALAPEFEASVPTERLRHRIDSAIARTSGVSSRGLDGAGLATVGGWLRSLSDVFAFKPRQAFGYAALTALLAFAVIVAVIQRHNSQPTSGGQEVASKQPTEASNPATAPTNILPAPEAVAANTDVTSAPGSHRPRRSSVATSSSRNPSAVASRVKLLPGERTYLQTIAELDSTIKQDTGRMKPALQAEYQRNLAFVDRALAAARTAAKSNPSDPDAAEFMFSAYQSKVDLLNTVADARMYKREQ